MMSHVFFSTPNPFMSGITIILLLLIVIWFVTATAASLRGNSVESPNRVAEMYGYTVCLVCVVTALISAGNIVGGLFDRGHPLQNEMGFGASLASFEAFRATYARERMISPEANALPDTASEATLRARFEGLRQDRIAATAYRTSKQLVTGGVMLGFAVALFLVHWKWLARQRARTLSAG
jgi:hypothetical protein